MPLGTLTLDTKITTLFPPNSKIISASPSGKSEWTSTSRLCLASKETDREMMEGEFNALLELHKTLPDSVPRSYGWGKLSVSGPGADTYFLLLEFIEMCDPLTLRDPEPEQLCRKLARLHRESTSPTGMFGFHVTTCQGNVPLYVPWEKSWTVFYSNLLSCVLARDTLLNGPWANLNTLAARAVESVIPRLLAPLESNGRLIKPSLIQGDMWEGNTGTSPVTGNIYLFDAAVFYAHSELELGNWRCTFNRIHDEVYTRTYLNYNPPDEPVREWDDRNRLYSVFYDVLLSVNHGAGGKPARQTAYDDLYYLVDKYAPFKDGTGPPRIKESERATCLDERDHNKG
ncbi:Fructosamine kinase-domain-containing protein [Aspergillus venezuelensis]